MCVTSRVWYEFCAKVMVLEDPLPGGAKGKLYVYGISTSQRLSHRQSASTAFANRSDRFPSVVDCVEAGLNKHILTDVHISGALMQVQIRRKVQESILCMAWSLCKSSGHIDSAWASTAANDMWLTWW